jgi:hypothetical protein
MQVKLLWGAPLYGRLLTLPSNIEIGWKRLAIDKNSSLLKTFVNYKKFCDI